MIRIASSTMYDRITSQLNQQQVRLAATQERISSGKNILRPSDAPDEMAALDRLESAARQSMRFLDNLAYGTAHLNNQEISINAFDDGVRRAYEVMLQASNDTYSDEQKEVFAIELEQLKDEFLQLANTRDEHGTYIFSGYVQETPPFSMVDGEVIYNGDDAYKTIFSDVGVELKIGMPGSQLFNNIDYERSTLKTSFTLALDGATSDFTLGTDAQSTADAPMFSINGTTIKFSAGASADEIVSAINDAIGDQGIVAEAITSGDDAGNIKISSDTGVDVLMAGAGFNNGDEHTAEGKLSASPLKSIFSILDLGIGALRSGDKDDLAVALDGINAASEHVAIQKVRLGTSMRALENQVEVLEAREVALDEAISRIKDLDYVTAVTELKNQSLALQAGQQSFAQLSSLSLFNYIR
jgi:flagellar hook-associated protein 3 FlgL